MIVYAYHNKSTHFQRIAHMASFDYHGFITLGRKDLVSFHRQQRENQANEKE